MSKFKFTEEAKDDLRIDLHTWDKQGLGFDWLVKAIEDNINSRIEQIVNERDGWIRVEKDSPDPKHEPFLATDGKSIWLSCLTEGGVYVENITGRRIFPTHYKIQSPPKTESK